jgi:hypothetical protein
LEKREKSVCLNNFSKFKCINNNISRGLEKKKMWEKENGRKDGV